MLRHRSLQPREEMGEHVSNPPRRGQGARAIYELKNKAAGWSEEVWGVWGKVTGKGCSDRCAEQA